MYTTVSEGSEVDDKLQVNWKLTRTNGTRPFVIEFLNSEHLVTKKIVDLVFYLCVLESRKREIIINK